MGDWESVEAWDGDMPSGEEGSPKLRHSTLFLVLSFDPFNLVNLNLKGDPS